MADLAQTSYDDDDTQGYKSHPFFSNPLCCTMDFTLKADCQSNVNHTKSINRQHLQQQQQHQTRWEPRNNHENIPVVNNKYAADGGALPPCTCDHNNNNNNNNNNGNNKNITNQCFGII